MPGLDASQLISTNDVLMITLDTLRYDVAMAALQRGETPNLAAWLPGGTWEKRHSPGNFTYAAHQAMFAGFLPTPAAPGKHPRLFAARFAGSETTTGTTCVFDAPDIVSGLSSMGYHTICIGGVGFFNKTTPLSCVLPDMFQESWWRPDFGVTHPQSTERQIEQAIARLGQQATGQRVFLFMNISALHQPNCHYLPGAVEDSPESQRAALAYVDSCMPALFKAIRARGPWLAIICSDHGTAYGEDGYEGHRVGHSVVWDVPYAEFVMTENACADER
jgi:hypothetical protein